MSGIERVSIREAAQRLGVSQDTIRRRIRAGVLPAAKVETPQGYVWLVELVVEQPEPGDATAAQDDRQATAADLALLQERVAGAERMIDELRADRDAWRERAQQDAEAAREMRVLLQQAQSIALALPAKTEAPQPQAQTIEQASAGGRWRWRRRSS
jgi:excisionase family DNA binding protein